MLRTLFFCVLIVVGGKLIGKSYSFFVQLVLCSNESSSKSENDVGSISSKFHSIDLKLNFSSQANLSIIHEAHNLVDLIRNIDVSDTVGMLQSFNCMQGMHSSLSKRVLTSFY